MEWSGGAVILVQIKCDRCKVQVAEHEVKDGSLWADRWDPYEKKVISYVRKHGQIGGTDLCPACEQSFNEWTQVV